ncbi:hypothetical protein BLOT_000527 [Blomia tropicalis]|nr:hypothetical protein BLOT_000527 [Blomia tropicalis]
MIIICTDPLISYQNGIVEFVFLCVVEYNMGQSHNITTTIFQLHDQLPINVSAVSHSVKAGSEYYYSEFQ